MAVMVSVYVLFWLESGLGLGQIMVLGSVFGIALLVFEIPTGVLADRFSRKQSLVIGALVQSAAGVILLSTTYFPLLILMYALAGLAAALRSGSGEALIYDSLKGEGREREFQRVAGWSLGWSHAGSVSGAIVAGLLARNFDLSSVIWARNALFLGAGVVTLSMREPQVMVAIRERTKGSALVSQIAGLAVDARSCFGIIARNQKILVLSAAALIIGQAGGLANIPFTQPYLVDFGLSPEHVAYFYAAAFGLAAISAVLSKRLTEFLHGIERRFIAVIVLTVLAGLVVMVNASTTLVAIAGLTLLFLTVAGLAPPFFSAAVNRRVPSAHRASVLSTTSMAFGLSDALLGPLFGFLADGYTLRTSLMIYQWTFIPLLLIAGVGAWRAFRPTAHPV